METILCICVLFAEGVFAVCRQLCSRLSTAVLMLSNLSFDRKEMMKHEERTLPLLAFRVREIVGGYQTNGHL